MKPALVHRLLQHPLGRRLGWVLYAIVFYLSGERFVVWLLEPQNFGAGIQWLGVVAFPVLLFGFFYLQRHLGCGSGHCRTQTPTEHRSTHDPDYRQPPGF